MYELCKDASDWIQKDPKNIVAIHCKAGKGRTGLMISCLLLYMNMCKTYSEALELFGTQRTSNGKGVTIPSQKRYVEYFSQFLQNFKLEPLKFQFQGIPLVLTNIRISTVPRVTKDKGCDLYVEIRDVKGRKIYDSRKTVKPKHSKDEDYIDIPCVASIRGDVKLFFYHAEEFSRRNPLVFQLWLNTSFIEENYLKLSKSQIDKNYIFAPTI
jgi:phosphatidylinositol-3,4,5-trisphosphate 3-phosphatase/dual-specificity protein phosphatase PTEN